MPQAVIPVPWQQAWPEPPQVVQVAGALPGGLLQPRPALQTLPGQQAWVLPPQGWQVVPPSAAWQECPAVQRSAAAPPQQV